MEAHPDSWDVGGEAGGVTNDFQVSDGGTLSCLPRAVLQGVRIPEHQVCVPRKALAQEWGIIRPRLLHISQTNPKSRNPKEHIVSK